MRVHGRSPFLSTSMKRRDTFERQADEAAVRILRGEKGVANQLTPAPAASFRLSTSIGQTLPLDVRSELEDGFGADLRAVRIHHNRYADSAAKSEGAKAFTSGRDIYFKIGAFNPTNEAGRKLITHEVAHVLQQTGRRSFDGMQVTNIVSSGEIQLTDDQKNNATVRKLKIFGNDVDRPIYLYPLLDSKISFDKLTTLHMMKGGSHSRKLKETIKKMKRRFDKYFSPNNSYGETLEAEVLNKQYDREPRNVRAFVLDCLKVMNRFEGSIYLLAKDIELKTFAHSDALYKKFVEKHGYGWLFKVLRLEPLDDFYPWLFVDRYRKYLLRSDLNVPGFNHHIRGDFGVFVKQQIEEVKTTEALVPNELFFACLLALYNVIVRQGRELLSLSNEVQSLFGHKNHEEKKMNQASLLRERLMKSKQESPHDESDYLYIQYIERSIAVANWAAQFWQNLGSFLKIKSFREVRLDKLRSSDYKRIRLSKKEFFTQERLLIIVNELFKLESDGRISSPKVYRGRIKKSRKQLKNILNQLEERTIRLVRRVVPLNSKRGKKDDSILALTYGLHRIFLSQLDNKLKLYDYKADKAFMKNFDGRPDVRIAHRIRIANFLKYPYAWIFGRNDVSELSKQVKTARQERQRMSLVALIGDWTVNNNPDISKIQVDLSAHQPIEGAGLLTPYHLVVLFKTAEWERRTKKYKEFYDKEKLLFDKKRGELHEKRDTIPNQVQKFMKGFSKPRRLSMKPFELAIRPKEEKKDGVADKKKSQSLSCEEIEKIRIAPEETKKTQDLSIDDLIHCHPKTLAAFKDNVGKEDRWVRKNQPTSDQPDLFYWIFPPWEAYIKRLRNVEELNALIYVQMRGVAKPKVEYGESPQKIALEIKKLTWQQWFALFEKIDPQKLGVENGRLIWNITTKLEQQQTASREDLIKKMRETMTLERWIMVERDIWPILNEFDNTNRTFSNPGKAGKEMVKISLQLSPRADQPIHLTAMILQLSSIIEKRLKKVTRYDLVIQYLGILLQAKKVINDTKARVVLMKLLTPKEKADDKFVSNGEALIDGVIASMRKQQRQIQFSVGFRALKGNLSASNDDDKPHMVSVSYPGIISAGKSFRISGVNYSLIDVYKNFTYHPDYGRRDTNSYSPSILKVEGINENKTIPPDQRMQENIELMKIYIQGLGKKIVRVKDDKILEQISQAIGLQVVVQDLEDLSEAIEAGGFIILEVVEFVPGAGQVVMGARLATAILQFLVSDEFRDIAKQFTEDPAEFFEEIIGYLDILFTPEELWSFLLFANLKFSEKLGKERKPPLRQGSRTTSAKLSRVVRRIFNVGKGLLGVAGRVQKGVRWKMEAMNLFVLRHPMLAFMLLLIADNMETTISLAEKAFSSDENQQEEDRDKLKKQLDDAIGGMAGKIVDVARHLETFQLPKELLPMEELLELILSFIMHRLSWKLRLIGGGIIRLLDIAGQKDTVFQAIADLIPDDANPNTFWEKQVKTPLEKKLHIARKELTESLFNHLLKYDLFEKKRDMFNAAQKPLGDNLKIKDGGAEEFEAYGLSNGMNLNSEQLESLPVESGQPLIAPLRYSAEQRFGHDFGHVRLHTGSGATTANNEIGAEGLTRGSHIYLGKGLSPTNSHGAHIFHHELTHVLQQTGPRPLGRHYNESPVPGIPGKGLLFDPQREATAEHVAQVADSGGTGIPVDIPPEKAEGVQPALPFKLIRSILDNLTGTGDIEKDADKAGGKVDAGFQKIPPTEVDRLDGFLNDLSTVISGNKKIGFRKPFHDKTAGEGKKIDIPNEIRTQLGLSDRGQSRKVVEKVFDDLIIDSLVSDKKAGKIVAVLDAGRFARALARFLFGTTGILMDIKVTSVMKNKGKVSVKSVDVIQVHLPLVKDHQSPLWTAALDSLKLQSDEEREDIFPRLLAYLTGTGREIGLGIWKRSNYGLQDKVRKAVSKTMRETPILKAEKLPPKADYLKLDAKDGGGLRLGSHKDLSDRTRVERESHHITQFLLLEYFANKNKSNQAFPLLMKEGIKSKGLYPGLDVDGREPKKFQPSSAKTIPIKDMKKGRGGLMPAILLARPTHRRAGLHIKKGDIDDMPNNEVNSQSGVIHTVFKKALPGKYVEAEKNNERFDFYKRSRLIQDQNTVNKEIYTAMQATYTWMREKMEPRLKYGLFTIERNYYNVLAVQKKSKDLILPAEMTDVYTKAIEESRSVMDRAGWNKPS